MDDREVQQLKKRVQETEVNARGRRRYTAALRKDIIQYIELRAREGVKKGDAADELGIPRAMAWRWARSFEKTPPRHMKRLAVAPSTPQAHPILVLPDGCRVENLHFDDIVALVRALR